MTGYVTEHVATEAHSISDRLAICGIRQRSNERRVDQSSPQIGCKRSALNAWIGVDKPQGIIDQANEGHEDTVHQHMNDGPAVGISLLCKDMRADALLFDGEEESAATWRQIVRRINEMEARPAEALH